LVKEQNRHLAITPSAGKAVAVGWAIEDTIVF